MLEQEDYFSWHGESASGLSWIKKSPRNYWWHKTHNTETEAMRFGTCGHMAFLEYDKFNSLIVDSMRPYPDKDFRNKENKEWRDSQAGLIISQSDKDIIEEIKALALKDWRVKKLLSNGIAETGFMIENFQRTGLACKVKPDQLKDTAIIDLKFCDDASFDGFQRSVVKYDYAMRSAFYVDVMEAIDRIKRDYIFICLEKTPPYHHEIYIADEQMLEIGRYEYEIMLKAIAFCTENQNFSYGYEFWNKEDMIKMKVPAWGIKDITSKYFK